MEHAISMQLQQFRLVNDRGLQLWLTSAWDTFCKHCKTTSGKPSSFLDELLHSDREWYFVPTRSIRQGSANNPFLEKDKQAAGYHCEVEPSKIARRLMECRKQLAEEWRLELVQLAEGSLNEEGKLVRQLLAGLVTRVAMREMLHDLSLLPSQKEVHSFVSHFMVQNTLEFEVGGDVEAMLNALAVQPVRIRGKTLLDPEQIAEEVRHRRLEIASKMAAALEDTDDEHRSVHSTFLEKCFNIEADD